MNKIRIITHRGLDPDRAPYHKESSLQAFEDQLIRGYGIEFDVQFSSDNQMIVIHDKSLERITNEKNKRLISKISSDEILAMNFNGDCLTTIPHLLSIIQTKSKPRRLSAFHLKSIHQTPERMNIILTALESIDPDKLIIFDATIESARYLKTKNSRLNIAASVSHPYDIERYNSAVGGTLITLEEVITHKDLFNWAWLDEWDLTNNDGTKKSLYNQKVFEQLRAAGIKIALVTPELHGTSPGLLGGEAHQDAGNREILNKRLAEIIALQPDAICTDHPDYVASLIEKA